MTTRDRILTTLAALAITPMIWFCAVVVMVL